MSGCCLRRGGVSCSVSLTQCCEGIVNYTSKCYSSKSAQSRWSAVGHLPQKSKKRRRREGHDRPTPVVHRLPTTQSMALQPLSIGDILMLSQTAWKIGRAFTQGKKSAPSEFAEVEREANGLSEALKLVAETLHTDDSILSQAEPETRDAVGTILESAGRTLSDLESFVERYQVIKKRDTNGGFVVERSWSDVVLANYKTFKWTTEGGDITELRNMLQMHTNTLNLILQALQSRSLARLEKTVIPMADRVADIHDRVTGDIGDKIDDLHRIIMAVANSTPSLVAKDRAIYDRNAIRNSSSTISTFESSPPSNDLNSTEARVLKASPQRTSSHSLPMRQAVRRGSEQSNHSYKATVKATRVGREDSAYYSMGPLPSEDDVRRIDWDFETGSPPNEGNIIGSDVGSRSDSGYIGTPTSRESNIVRRESTTLPNRFSAIDEANAETGSSQDASYSGISPAVEATGYASKTHSVQSSVGGPILPPPAIPPEPPEGQPPTATPSSYFGSSRRNRSDTDHDREGGRPQIAKSARRNKVEQGKTSGSPIAPFDDPAFEKLLFRNSAILCDVRGKLVEYAHHIADEPDPRYNTEMKAACEKCRICVIRKRENREHGGTRVVTSVWTLSDHGEVRCQQKLFEANETVPYCSWFDPLKVSLTPSEGEISLKFHAKTWGDMLEEEKKTKWINYVFGSENDATAFQSAIFGRMLLGSYRTTKTTVIHEGLKGSFAFEEQFANIEMLRLWKDDGVTTPGAAGGVLALMHISSNFGEGWARWWINSSKQQVRIKEDGPRHAKVKGIDITVVKPGAVPSIANKVRSQSTTGEGLQTTETNLETGPQSGGKRIQVKKVTGVRIEFKTEEERDQFVSASKTAQERMILLPDL